MREIKTDQIVQTVRSLCIEANIHLRQDVIDRIQSCRDQETSTIGRQVLGQILENADVARTSAMPICQDTGATVVLLKVGQDVHITGGSLSEAIHEGVRQGYEEGFLRKSIVQDPFRRTNTGDNTPAFIHTEIVPGDQLKITIIPKGGGSENMSEARMLTPSQGLEGVKQFVINRVRISGGNPCPPVIVGVGIGGTLEVCTFLAKKAIIRPIGQRHPDSFYAELETSLLNEINQLGIGPQAFGGRCTALEVFVEVRPCHIASLPVAVNMQCHAARHGEAVL
ncbi:fumarate hydratase [candidate division KSB1 bacterium]|nr:fumarate hydratase [candidate division KSB1 bacterium]